MTAAEIDHHRPPHSAAALVENRLGTMTTRHRPTAFLIVVVGLVLWCTWSDPAIAAEARFDLPSPLAGPGVPEVKKSQRKKIDRGWRELAAGNLRESRKRSERAADSAPNRLLRFQIRIVEEKADAIDELGAFCKGHPEYAAAWMTLSFAAEHSGDESTALDAARRGARLWPDPPWGARAADLERRWIDDRIAHAERLFDAGDNPAALAELDAASALDPERGDSALLEARIHFSDDELGEAEARLADISELPEAMLLLGQIAEKRGNWQSAMEIYSSLPDGYTGRIEALDRAQTYWRMTLLPNYARAAMESENLTRGDLAVILVSVLPRLETMPGGGVPVMSDIVDHPGQREIITIVRLGIMTADRRGHLFYPDTEADMETVRQAVHKSRSLLGLSDPRFCTHPDVLVSDCISIPSPASGGSVVNAVLDPTSGATP